MCVHNVMSLSVGTADGEECGAPAGAEEEPGGHGSLQEHQPLLHQPRPGESHHIYPRAFIFCLSPAYTVSI